MDAKQSWERLKSQIAGAADGEALLSFAEELAQSGEPAVANYAAADPVARQRALRRLWAGGLHSVGSLPQFDLCLLAALGHAALGKQVFVISPLPASPILIRHATQLLGDSLGLDVRASGVVFGQPTSRLKQALKADVIFTDSMQLFEVARGNAAFLEREQTVAVLCEADLSLYDSRLGLFDRSTARAVAAVYRTTMDKPPWEKDGNVVDSRDVLAQFGRLDGVLSYTNRHVVREMKRVYGPLFPAGIACRSTRDLPALAFRTLEEKASALCRDILKAEGDCLVFMGDEEFRQNLYRNLRQRDQEPTLLGTSRDLRTFLGMKSSRKRVGLFRGMPTTLTQPFEPPERMNTFLAEHLLMGHQHLKLRAFCERDLPGSPLPTLYFSLEDEMFDVYADQAHVEKFFQLIDFTEKYDKWRQIRRVMARAVLRRIRSLRRACLNEEYPIFTFAGVAGSASPQANKPQKKSRKTVGKKLEGLCFCGSGKPFRECHGKSGA
jgi:hypothetical protein